MGVSIGPWWVAVETVIYNVWKKNSVLMSHIDFKCLKCIVLTTPNDIFIVVQLFAFFSQKFYPSESLEVEMIADPQVVVISRIALFASITT